jgi:hypothetical protein
MLLPLRRCEFVGRRGPLFVTNQLRKGPLDLRLLLHLFDQLVARHLAVPLCSRQLLSVTISYEPRTLASVAVNYYE